MFRWTLVALLLALAVVLGYVLDAQSRTTAVYPELTNAPSTIYALGRVEGATRPIELRCQLAGRIAAVHVREGQVVEQDAVLLELDAAQYRCEVAQAEAELAQAKAQLERLVTGARPQERRQAAARYHAKLAELERAELAWKRVRELQQSNAVSAQQADDQRTAVAALTAEVEAANAALELIEAPPRQDEVRLHQARVAAARARLELANVMLKRCQLRAPTRAAVLKVDAEPGELTAPDAPQPVIVLADTSRFRVRAFVEEYDAPRLAAGMPAQITADGLPGQTFTGRVAALSPAMTRKELWSDHPTERYDTKTREVWIDLDPTPSHANLVVGLRVEVAIAFARSHPPLH